MRNYCSDPTANAAIANVMREQRKKLQELKKAQAVTSRPVSDGTNDRPVPSNRQTTNSLKGAYRK